eukprot:1156099-Pelagomonas_calceolata.AAC.9
MEGGGVIVYYYKSAPCIGVGCKDGGGKMCMVKDKYKLSQLSRSLITLLVHSIVMDIQTNGKKGGK